MKSRSHTLKAKLWMYQDDSPWHFLTIEKSDAQQIIIDYVWPRRGFGSMPVYATIGKTTWKTSIFPDKNKTYVLPVKKEIRLKEGITAGDLVPFSIEILN